MAVTSSSQLNLDHNSQVKYRYHAFLSYAHEDKKTVEWLHRLLSKYWVPWKRRRRIFMDQESMSVGGGLSDRLQTALKESQFLIVCCSQAATNSEWVELEINEFIKSHAVDNVLVCSVGPKTGDLSTAPQAIHKIERSLNDHLFKPDLRGNPGSAKGKEARIAEKSALSLLAPLVGFPSKDELLDRRKKNLVITSIFLFIAMLATVGWALWIRSDAYQIRAVLYDSQELIASSLPGRVNEFARDLVVADRLEEAITIARQIKDPEDQDQAFESQTNTFLTIAKMLAGLGRTGAAKGTVEKALVIARTIKHPTFKAMALSRVVQVMVNAGETDNSLALVSEITAPEDQSLALAAIANEFVKTGKMKEAISAADEALACWHKSWERNGGVQVRYFGKVFEAAVKVGRTKEALAIAREIPKPETQCQELIIFAQALARLGKQTEAVLLLDEALATVRRELKPDSAPQMFAWIAESYTECGDKAAAVRVMNDALTTVRTNDKPESQIQVFVRAIKLLAKVSEKGQAMKVLNEALIIAPSVDLPSRRMTFATVAEALIGVGKYDEALEVWRKK